MNKYLLSIPLLIIAFVSISYMPVDRVVKGSIPSDSTVTITISAVGDIMCHSVQYNYARVSSDSFDFRPVFREVKKYLSESDFTFGNFETVTAGKEKGYSGYPFFNSPDDLITALKDAGFDILTTSNNHSLDRGEHGVRRTIEQLNKNGIGYNGTFVSENDRDSIRIFNIKGILTAILAYTYGTNGNPVPKGKPYLINLINNDLLEKDIISARSKGADLVIVHFHFGEEYKREPVKSQVDAVNKAKQCGADIVIGGHPHVLQPAEFYPKIAPHGKLDTGFVAWSLGNFISNQRWRYSDAGVILNLKITKNFTSDSLYVSGADFIPTWVFKGNTSRGKEYIILPAGLSSYEYLTGNDISAMKQAFEDTKNIITKYNTRIDVKAAY